MSEPEHFEISASMHASSRYIAELSSPVSSFSKMWFTIRRRWATVSTADDSDALFQATLANGKIQITDTSEVAVDIETDDIPPGMYPADFKVLATNGARPFVAATGHVRILPTATVSKS